MTNAQGKTSGMLEEFVQQYKLVLLLKKSMLPNKLSKLPTYKTRAKEMSELSDKKVNK